LVGAVADLVAVSTCYPLDLVRTRLTTQLKGYENYRGIADAFQNIYQSEGLPGFYNGIAPTMLVAVPNFAFSYSVYGTLKEYTLDDKLINYFTFMI
jgi:solute carrier family 25 (mitochondrial phosphate transporter), member 23/24/25/41